MDSGGIFLIGYILVGKAAKGKWIGEWVIVGTLMKNSFFIDVETAEDKLEEAKIYLKKLEPPEIEPGSLQIGIVRFTDNLLSVKEGI